MKVIEGLHKSELRKSVIPLFLGDPGIGKTKLIEKFAKDKGVNLIEMITSTMSPFEVSGITMPDAETKEMIHYNYGKLAKAKDGDIIFFDELLNGNITVLNACLTVLEQRQMISGQKLPDVMIIAAANPQGATPLTPQIKERFVWYPIKANKSMWAEYMNSKYFMHKEIVDKLWESIKNEDFKGDNFNTPRSIDKAVAMVIEDIPTPYSIRVRHCLETLIGNPFEEAITLPDGKILEPKELIRWLDLIKLKNGVTKK